MNVPRQFLEAQIAQLLGCAKQEEYPRRRAAFVAYLKRVRPEAFQLEGGRKRAFEHMARMEGLTLEDKPGDMAILGFITHKSFGIISRDAALASLSSCGLEEPHRLVVEQILDRLLK